MDELKPCPFCGGPAEHDSSHYIGQIANNGLLLCGHAIYCADTGCVGCPVHSVVWTEEDGGFEAAAEAWNTRTNPHAHSDVVDLRNQALLKVIAYDQLLRKIGEQGEYAILFNGTLPSVDAVYDDMVRTAAAALQSRSNEQDAFRKDNGDKDWENPVEASTDTALAGELEPLIKECNRLQPLSIEHECACDELADFVLCQQNRILTALRPNHDDVVEKCPTCGHTDANAIIAALQKKGNEMVEKCAKVAETCELFNDRDQLLNSDPRETIAQAIRNIKESSNV